MSKLYAIIGETGSGKSTILDAVLDRIKNDSKYKDLTKLIYSTTRAPRENEIDGVDYHFRTSEDFYDKICFDDVIEFRQYNTKDNGTIIYFTTIYDFDTENKIGALSPDQVNKCIDKEDISVYSIIIKTSLKDRVTKLINRCKTDIEVEEALRRIRDEKMEFNSSMSIINNFSKDLIEVYNDYTEDGLDKIVDQIIDFIAKNYN